MIGRLRINIRAVHSADRLSHAGSLSESKQKHDIYMNMDIGCCSALPVLHTAHTRRPPPAYINMIILRFLKPPAPAVYFYRLIHPLLSRRQSQYVFIIISLFVY